MSAERYQDVVLTGEPVFVDTSHPNFGGISGYLIEIHDETATVLVGRTDEVKIPVEFVRPDRRRKRPLAGREMP